MHVIQYIPHVRDIGNNNAIRVFGVNEPKNVLQHQAVSCFVR